MSIHAGQVFLDLTGCAAFLADHVFDSARPHPAGTVGIEEESLSIRSECSASAQICPLFWLTGLSQLLRNVYDRPASFRKGRAAIGEHDMKSTSDRASTSRQATGDTMAIVTAWLATNRMNANEVPGFIRSVHEAVIEISGVTQPAVTERGPVRAAPAKAAGRGKADRPAPKKAETRSKPAPARKETKAEAPEVRSAGNGHDVVPPLPRKLERKLSRVQLPEGFQRAQTPEDVDRIVAETVHPDGIICVLDGVKKRMLKRHVRAAWGLEWEEYLTLVGLPEDYPSACSNLLEEKRMAALESIGGEKMKQARERASRRRRRDAARGGAEGEAQSDRRAA